MANDLIKTAEVARLLGVQLTTFNGGRATLAGFPAPVGKDGNAALYSRRAVLRWANGKNPKALFSQSVKARNAEIAEQAAARLAAFNRSAVAMISGAFLPPAQRERQAMKKLAARISQPKTTRVTLAPDWMNAGDDPVVAGTSTIHGGRDKEHQPQKANYRR